MRRNRPRHSRGRPSPGPDHDPGRTRRGHRLVPQRQPRRALSRGRAPQRGRHARRRTPPHAARLARGAPARVAPGSAGRGPGGIRRVGRVPVLAQRRAPHPPPAVAALDLPRRPGHPAGSGQPAARVRAARTRARRARQHRNPRQASARGPARRDDPGDRVRKLAPPRPRGDLRRTRARHPRGSRAPPPPHRWAHQARRTGCDQGKRERLRPLCGRY